MKLGKDAELILSILRTAVRPLRIAEILDEGLESFTPGLRARGESSSKHQQQSARDSVSTLCNKLRHAGLAVSEGRPAVWSAVKPVAVDELGDELVDRVSDWSEDEPVNRVSDLDQSDGSTSLDSV